VSLIPQEPLLFHRTLRENIRYGRMEATDEEVVAAAKRAHAHDFILAQKRGYEALVGERGIRLSGGQRQRVAIARAVLKDSPVVLMDEATSSLDSVTEKAIQEGLEELMRGRTVMVIAHRLSTISHLDRILVFHEGKVVEDGSHTQLLARGGHYARLWSMQAGGFLPENEAQSEEVLADEGAPTVN
jgi:ATP-binding cassette subfamily B protein